MAEGFFTGAAAAVEAQEGAGEAAGVGAADEADAGVVAGSIGIVRLAEE